MTGKGRERLTLSVGAASILAVLIMLALNLYETASVRQSVHTMMRHVTQQKTTMVSRWESINMGHAYTTHLGEHDPTESDSAHADRHRAGVGAMLAVFPKE